MVYAGDDLVSYELDEFQIGAKGHAEIRRDTSAPAKSRICFEYSTDARSKTKTDSESLQRDTLVNDMIAPFLTSNWDALMSGHEVKCRYIVIPRKETVGFEFRKHSESKREGRNVVTIRMKASSVIIGALIDSIFFTVEKDPPHRVLEYLGRTTPKIKSGSKWKDLDAITVFDWP